MKLLSLAVPWLRLPNRNTRVLWGNCLFFFLSMMTISVSSFSRMWITNLEALAVDTFDTEIKPCSCKVATQ